MWKRDLAANRFWNPDRQRVYSYDLYSNGEYKFALIRGETKSERFYK